MRIYMRNAMRNAIYIDSTVDWSSAIGAEGMSSINECTLGLNVERLRELLSCNEDRESRKAIVKKILADREVNSQSSMMEVTINTFIFLLMCFLQKAHPLSGKPRKIIEKEGMCAQEVGYSNKKI